MASASPPGWRASVCKAMPTLAHTPVLLTEAVDLLAVHAGGHYVDCTLGRGGHSGAILARGGEVLALDADAEAIAAVTLPLRAIHANFDRLEEVVHASHFDPLDGVLFDLGLSSPQLDDARRGFAFSQEGPLDMRFDSSGGQTAAELVNNLPVQQLARLFREYGEEPRAQAMAAALDARRRQQPFRTTTELAGAIQQAAGGRGRVHPATRIFQALRIAVNDELDRLRSALTQALALLQPGGRLVAISFHSLEDRAVKTFLAREARDCICPPRTPVCVCGHHRAVTLLTRKPITPSRAEVAANPRARSAKLRAAARL